MPTTNLGLGSALYARMKAGQPHVNKDPERSVLIMQAAAEVLGITKKVIERGLTGPHLLKRSDDEGRKRVKRSEAALSTCGDREKDKWGVYYWYAEVKKEVAIESVQMVVDDRVLEVRKFGKFSPESAQRVLRDAKRVPEVCPPSNSHDLSTHSHDRLLACMSIIPVPCRLNASPPPSPSPPSPGPAREQ